MREDHDIPNNDNDAAPDRIARWSSIPAEERSIAHIGFHPEPGTEWHVYQPSAEDRTFNDLIGVLRCRIEPDGKVRFRSTPRPEHRNLANVVHGGFILGLIDIILFIGPAMLGVKRAMGGVTIDVSTQFLGPVLAEEIDVLIEVMQETGRLIFTRGTFEQGGKNRVMFSGTTRKASPAR